MHMRSTFTAGVSPVSSYFTFYDGKVVFRKSFYCGDYTLSEEAKELLQYGIRIRSFVSIGIGAKIYPNVEVGASCRIGSGVTINSGTVIGRGTSIGENACIDPNVTIGLKSNVCGYAIVTKSLPMKTEITWEPPKGKTAGKSTWEEGSFVVHYNDGSSYSWFSLPVR